MLKDLLIYMTRNLVDDPDSIDVSEISGAHAVILELKVAKEDVGKVVGKGGRTAQALRDILNAASGKHGTRVVLNILD